MHQLGQTRSCRSADHTLMTADTFVRMPLPGMKKCTAVIHAAPVLGTAFTQYTAECEADGELGQAQTQRFIYVLEGNVQISTSNKETLLEVQGYAFFPEGLPHRVIAKRASRLIVIEKIYQPLEAVQPPKLILSSENTVNASPLEGDPDVQVKCLLPDMLSFDFAVNILTFQPGAALNKVEMHIMEHGLLMLEGSGIYRLGSAWYPVTVDDFIWMGPWCPQWFCAIGKIPAKYIIYKDWNRYPSP